jgi:hypothetical protein
MDEQKTQLLSDLLARLETQAEEGLNRVVLEGHAVGKGADSLHLAIASGVVAIPLSEIEDVKPTFGAPSPDWVSVVVRNGDRVEFLRRIGQFPGDIPTPGAGQAVERVGTRVCVDIPTVTSREGLDQTDGALCVVIEDPAPPRPGGGGGIFA